MLLARLAGMLGMIVIGGTTGAAASVSMATNLGIIDLESIRITALIGGALGILGGVSVSIGTLWSGDATREGADTRRKQLPTRLGMAQFAWALIAAGISLPYLAIALLTVLHWSQAGTVKLDGSILSHAAGLLGAILWIDGVVLQLLTAVPPLPAFLEQFFG